MMSVSFKGNRVSLAIFILSRCYHGCSFYASNLLYLLKGSLLRLVPELRPRLPDCHRVLVLYDHIWAPSGSRRQTQMPFHISWPHKGLFMITYSLAFRFSSHGVNIFRTAQLPMQKINNRVHEWSLSKPLSLSPLTAVFVPVSRHLYTGHQWDFPCSLPTSSRGWHKHRVGAFRESTYSIGPSSTHTFRDSGLVDRMFLYCK